MAKKQKKKIGLLGGSFNPAHEGHVHISVHAADRLGLDEVWWLVSPQNPLKPAKGMAPLKERVASAKKIVNDPIIKISTIESDLGTQYTIDAIKALQKKFPSMQFVWLMGADNLVDCHKWKDWEEIFSRVPVAVLDRSPYSNKALCSITAKKFKNNLLEEMSAKDLIETKTPAWVYLNIPIHPASSSAIRNKNNQ